MKIKVVVKTVYGNELVYPICDKGKALAELTGKKTLSPKHIELIKALGFELELVAQGVAL